MVIWFGIADAYRGISVGGRRYADWLLDAVVQDALKRDLAGLSAYVDRQNVRAVRFWTGVGFERVPSQQPYLDDDGSKNDLYVLIF